jgi:hypothetical protein
MCMTTAHLLRGRKHLGLSVHANFWGCSTLVADKGVVLPCSINTSSLEGNVLFHFVHAKPERLSPISLGKGQLKRTKAKSSSVPLS